MAKFSLIISAYKVAPYLRACLDSCLKQTFTDWEAICVDDGSPDESGAILDEYAARDSRFKIIHQHNSGVSVARNVGLEAATADWLWFIDGDDMIVPCALQCLSEEIETHRHLPVHSISFDCEPVTCQMTPRQRGVVSSRQYFERIDSRVARTFYCAAWSKLFKRSAIGLTRYFDRRYREDTVFTIEYSVKGKGWLLLDAKLYSYRKRPGSTTCSNLSKARVAEIFEAENILLDRILDAQRNHPDADLTELIRTHHYQCYGTYEGGYFKLPAKERSELLSQWLALQRRFDGLYPFSPKIRMSIALVQVFRSGFLAKFFVQGLGKLNMAWHKLCVMFWR